MSKLILTHFGLLLAMLQMHAQSIATVRDLPLGTVVTVEGVVTNGSSLGNVRYMQDSTGGIALFPGTGSVAGFAEQVSLGDRVIATGPLFEFNSLLEVSPITAFEVISADNELPEPLTIETTDITESLEGQLVRINEIEFLDGGGVFQGNTSYPFSTPVGNSVIYIRTDHPLVGTMIPAQSIDLIGLMGQFRDEYQLLPRGEEDFIIGNLQFTNGPVVRTLSSESIEIDFATNQATNYNIDLLTLDGSILQQFAGSLVENQLKFTVDDLPAAEIFDVLIEVGSDDGITTSTTRRAATYSNSSGVMEVYFSDSLRLSNGIPNELKGQEISLAEDMLVRTIENATESVDVAFFNNSTNFVVNALNDAVERGVRVRYVTDEDSFNGILNGTINFPIQRIAEGDPLMHHKFIIADADSEAASFVVTGSANLSLQNFYTDINNLIRIQDQLLARIYQLEMDEMWGGVDAMPNADLAKSGAQKIDNTPHEVMIGDRLVEVYFSPSDRTTAQIERSLQSADSDISLGLLTLTRNDLGDVLVEKFAADLNVRAIINNTNDQGTEFDRLVQTGIPAETHTFDPIFHHKYGIIDAYAEDSDPIVITGSHNWTNAAEDRNDENTLIIHSAAIASIYQSEFEARWCELRPAECLSTQIQAYDPLKNIDVFPNPTSDLVTFRSQQWPSTEVVICISTMNSGQRLYSTTLVDGDGILSYDLTGLPAGAYVVELIFQKHKFARTIIKH